MTASAVRMTDKYDDFIKEFGLDKMVTLPRPDYMNEDGNFDCQKCGACCIESGYVVVDPEALAKLDLKIIVSHPAHGEIPVLDRHIGGRCKQLQGVVGKDCKCGIYENRPSVCRLFQPGSEACLAARSAMRCRSQSPFRPRGYGENWQETVNV